MAEKQTQNGEVAATPKNKNIKEFTSANGTTYTFQKVSPVAWLDIMDEIEGAGQRRKLYGSVLENIIVQPRMKLEEFTDFAELDEVVTAAIRFQRGK
jgi:hypothetical protein